MNKNIIEVENLIKKFNDFTAFNDISFSVKEGEICAFLWPNDAGKTTTIKILTTLLKPTKEKVLLNNFDVISDPNKVRKSFEIVFQDQSLDDELTAFPTSDNDRSDVRWSNSGNNSRINCFFISFLVGFRSANILSCLWL
ncbi:MAG: ATP-binding cassette domain-containing protein [Patescibacteria group bacterium]|nr:ATP-binding cassette domain-containing protein [Patescibacteria group bacterium]